MIMEKIVKEARRLLAEEGYVWAGDGTPAQVLQAVADLANDTPTDAEGKTLRKGDLVRFGETISVIKEIRKRAGYWQAILMVPNYPVYNVPLLTKVTYISHEEYLPLARRMMEPGLSKKEKLAFLVMGLFEEAEKYRKTDSRKEERPKEAGSLLWYVDQLWDEVGNYEGDRDVLEGFFFGLEDPQLWGSVRKAIFQNEGEEVLQILVENILSSLTADLGGPEGLDLARAESVKEILRSQHQGA